MNSKISVANTKLFRQLEQYFARTIQMKAPKEVLAPKNLSPLHDFLGHRLDRVTSSKGP
ncbi:hypothetical protein MUO83_04920 [Candidatus Bathyarchaeota archaeon]|nr:hypothetical protein [Candidatus Bathyarchaeota archaeon]